MCLESTKLNNRILTADRCFGGVAAGRHRRTTAQVWMLMVARVMWVGCGVGFATQVWVPLGSVVAPPGVAVECSQLHRQNI